MAKLEEIKVGEVYTDIRGEPLEIVFVDSRTCLYEREGRRYATSLVADWTLVKPERELWNWRVKTNKKCAWYVPISLFCDDGLDSNGQAPYGNWHDLEKEKLTALGSVKVEG